MTDIPITYIRIKQLRQQLKMSQGELAIRTGYTDRSTIAKIEAGKIDIGQKKLVVFAEALETSTAYLMGLVDNPAPQQSSPLDIPGIVPLPKTYSVPLLGEIACGDPILAEQNIADQIPVPEHIKGADFALTCRGDSMINARIHDGDIVYIRQQPDVDDGDIAAVLIDNEATLKRVYKMPGRLQLRAENPAYPPINVEGDDLENVRILGKAIAFLSPVK